MRDLGLGLDDVADTLEAEAQLSRLVCAYGAAPTEQFTKAMRAELWLDEMSLKREILRSGALQFFAGEGAKSGPPTAMELMDARRCIARLTESFRWETVTSRLTALGVSADELAAVTADIALARRAGLPIAAALDRPAPAHAHIARAGDWDALGLNLGASPKASGSARFSLTEDAATTTAEAIAEQIGIYRIGLIGELDTLGVHIAQAFRERGKGWSSSFSSGKAETRAGARVGSIMEEAEIYAQDGYSPKTQIRTSWAASSETLPLVDPRELGLPYDSRYTEDLEMDWSACIDLVSCRTVLVPSAFLINGRQFNDPLYSPRLGGKVFSTSGLASGFTAAEAIVHAGAEYIERHAHRLSEIEIDNPGAVGGRAFRFIDEHTLPETPARIMRNYHDGDMVVRILDITSDIAVPTFAVRVFDDLFRAFHSVSSEGYACHPDPEVAITMALLEAAQTRVGYVAGAREDYSLQARSLGRHERPRTAVPRSQAFWFGNDRPLRPFDDNTGFHARDILEELEWIVDRVVIAGYPMFLVADYTISDIQPAHAARVLIPGFEVTNPLFTGRRARATVIRDILPNNDQAR
jgi:ribosomal protein S12 methylthiotransferase accessory factor